MVKAEVEEAFEPRAFLRTVPHRPGVYRMVGAGARVLYVGKACDLRKRVASYFRATASGGKTRAMLAQMRRVEITVTHTENEALLLENNLIKSLKPRYNVLFRDDKSYPYIFLSQAPFPRLAVHRGAQRAKGRYFGPYPSAISARNTLSLLQKIFPVRQCEDNFYKNRSRPCLQYQIKRCSAPCVDLINKDDYSKDVKNVCLFLEGKENTVIDHLVSRMENTANKQDYESAALYRDQISYLRRTQDKQYISNDAGNIDVIAAMVKANLSCIEVFYIRNGRNLGSKIFFPKHSHNANLKEILSAFISQRYLQDKLIEINTLNNKNVRTMEIPSELLINEKIDDLQLFADTLCQIAGHKVNLLRPLKGKKKQWMALAEQNAKIALDIHIADKMNILKRFEALQDMLELDSLPQRVECFDISHTQGEATVASCVVFDITGPIKSDYRRFNIEGITAGDDYAAIKQALQRRYIKTKESEAVYPDILFIDGGKGQVTQAKDVFRELQITDVLLIGVAKGAERKPGLETLIICNYDESNNTNKDKIINLSTDSAALHLIQHVRDEAHRFAITGHRQRRAKARSKSILEEIKGLGAKRRQQLLKQFGGLQEISRAGVDDIASVKGVSEQLRSEEHTSELQSH